jgi:hypothetical protein
MTISTAEILLLLALLLMLPSFDWLAQYLYGLAAITILWVFFLWPLINN